MPAYDPKKVLLIVNGAQISGYADGTFINVEFNNDKWTTKVGADGEHVHSKTNDNSATVTVTLLPGAAGNAIFQAQLLLDEVDNLGIFAMMVRDQHSNTLHATRSGRVMKQPTSVYSQEAEGKEWVITVGNMSATHGISTETA